MRSSISNFIFGILDGSIIKFKDRQTASELLCSILQNKIQKIPANDVLILGIPMGGIITGDVIAKKFGCQFDIIIPRRILSPNNKELAIGAIMKDKTIYINPNPTFLNPLEISTHYLNSEKEKALREIQNIEDIVGKQIEPNRINGKNIIIVDDGVATGATLILTSRWIRKFNPIRLTILTPICPRPIFKQLKEEVDNIESIITPLSRNFTTVEQFYQNFQELDYKDVQKIVKNYRNKNS